tara:strand:+ start:816 stop:1034 length:219 start_codon:yes stop_codon:yes gene_type:complete
MADLNFSHACNTVNVSPKNSRDNFAMKKIRNRQQKSSKDLYQSVFNVNNCLFSTVDINNQFNNNVHEDPKSS